MNAGLDKVVAAVKDNYNGAVIVLVALGIWALKNAPK